MMESEEIRRLARQIENKIDASILPDGTCLFDPIKVRLALELVLSVLQAHSSKTEESN